ncbi:hypothetical protein PR202_gb24852 [Eleusine coracana subsp. coracana]|uniref:Uncharacterized protein n=1 Tax=Eleusine coracana subsp. coracana TaxID=191504 RepID=A0AAV5FN26_ELECO|nr:hypothetical protein PR202_gb24852 [Eleusine coracana subsp. coracana]
MELGLQNPDAKIFAPNPNTEVRSCMGRHQLQGASPQKDFIVEDHNPCLVDPETKEPYFRPQSQEEEILLLRKKVAAASAKELRLLSEKHILERKLIDLRKAVDEMQEKAICDALKQLRQRANHLEEIRDWRVEEEELNLFTCSILSMLAEYNVHPSQINASTITAGVKVILTRSVFAELYLLWSYVLLLCYVIHEFVVSSTRDDVLTATPLNYIEENAVTNDIQFYRHGNPLPGIEGFQIVGEPRPGCILRACGFPTNGTTLCNFQWVRYFEDGTRHSIEGKAGNLSYIVKTICSVPLQQILKLRNTVTKDPIFEPLGLQQCAPGQNEISFASWWRKAIKKVKKGRRKRLNTMIIMGAWIICKHRNLCVFERANRSITSLLSTLWNEHYLLCLAGARRYALLMQAGL